LLYILRSFEARPIDATLDELECLAPVSIVEFLIDPFSEESLFELQMELCVNSPLAISTAMRWDDAGQLPLKDAIRIVESLNKRNAELARLLKSK